MTRIYLSSTYSDLIEYREAVYHVLRKMGYDVIAMEDYVASDQRPLDTGLADVARCDLYIGLFAWRYGYIPEKGNPEGKSITELEYRKAQAMEISCLLFLLDEETDWPRKWTDEITDKTDRGERINVLRQELAREHMVDFFKSSEHLAHLVSAAVHRWEQERKPPSGAAGTSGNAEKQAKRSEREQRLYALLADHRGLLRDRLASFVGREAQLVDIRQRISQTLPTGGYVTITGQAGQGKSSIIAKLVEEYGEDQVAYHFIPFNPGPDHQVSLLPNLMARLILKYDLTDLYVASESRPALSDYFSKVLAEVVAHGRHEIIFVDGLDQLEEDLSGWRDLSFLPTNPPSGIVFVLGTRPNDTLKPLKLLKPYGEYQLPGLSRQDFDRILTRRGVMLERQVADQFYEQLQENALYLDLVARELQEHATLSLQEMIVRLAHDPANLYSLSIMRLKRQALEWREVIKPVLGVLLAAREPLAFAHLRQILHLEADRLRDALTRLGGLVADTGEQRYILYHLKFRDYLKQDEQYPDKGYIFASDEEEQWHAIIASWCEQGQLALIWEETKDVIEQGRRAYARRHYVAHLYYAHQWQDLFHLLDEGSYWARQRTL